MTRPKKVQRREKGLVGLEGGTTEGLHSKNHALHFVVAFLNYLCLSLPHVPSLKRSGFF